MRGIVSSIVMLIVALPTIQAFAGAKPTAQEIIQREIEVSGANVLRDAGAVYRKDLVTRADGVSWTQEQWTTSDGVIYIREERSDGVVYEHGAYQGRAWFFGPTTGAKLRSFESGWSDLQGADIDFAADPDRFHALGRVSAKRIEGNETWKVKLEVVPGEERTYYFDQESGQLVATETPIQFGGSFWTYLSDFVEIDGRTLPREMRTANRGWDLNSTLVEFDIDPPSLPDLTPRDEVLALIEASGGAPGLTGSRAVALAHLDIPDVAPGESARIPSGYVLAETLGMISSVDSQRVKGVDNEGDCRAALVDARSKVIGGPGCVRFAIEDGDPVDEVECNVSKKNKAVVKFQAVIINHGETEKISELDFAEAWELIQAIRGAPTVGDAATDLDYYSFSISEWDGKLYFYARSQDQANTYPEGMSTGRRAAKSFYDRSVLGGNDLANMISLLEQVPVLDGVMYQLTYRYFTGPETDDDERVMFLFERGAISESPRASLAAVQAFLIGEWGRLRPDTEEVDIDEMQVPEVR